MYIWNINVEHIKLVDSSLSTYAVITNFFSTQQCNPWDILFLRIQKRRLTIVFEQFLISHNLETVAQGLTLFF